MNDVLLEVQGLRIEFPLARGTAIAARDLSFQVRAGECLAIVGESGSGKSMTCLGILDLVPPPGRVTGNVSVGGRTLTGMPARELRRTRGDEISVIFQDPSAALNPLFTVERQITDVIRAHRDWSKKRVRTRVVEVLEAVRFPDAVNRMRSYPHELSGGLRQRVCIAMALACEPKVVLADEPTTNLDVGVQAQIIDLLAELKRQLHFAIVFVTHDLPLAQRIADRVLVMYAGHAVEAGPAGAVLVAPAHPYTIGLLRSAPRGESHQAGRLTPIPGVVPTLGSTGDAAPFFGRCPVAVASVCDRAIPGWTRCGPDHLVACHRFERDGYDGTRQPEKDDAAKCTL